MDGRQLAMSVQTHWWRRARGGLVDSSLSPPLFSILGSPLFIVSDVLLVCTADAL